jgi:hypothetical protein
VVQIISTSCKPPARAYRFIGKHTTLCKHFRYSKVLLGGVLFFHLFVGEVFPLKVLSPLRVVCSFFLHLLISFITSSLQMVVLRLSFEALSRRNTTAISFVHFIDGGGEIVAHQLKHVLGFRGWRHASTSILFIYLVGYKYKARTIQIHIFVGPILNSIFG